jgi:predicted ATPase
VEAGLLKADPLQVEIAQKLQGLFERIEGYEPPSLSFFDDLDRRTAEKQSRMAKKKTDFIKEHGPDAVVPNFEDLEEEIEPFVAPKGIYLHGPVGCGKTLLLDLFYDSCKTEKKARVHFHAFVLLIHSEMNRWRYSTSEEDIRPLESITRNLMKDSWLICFDEIQHTDYGSSVLLQQIFSFMLSKGKKLIFLGHFYTHLITFFPLLANHPGLDKSTRPPANV